MPFEIDMSEEAERVLADLERNPANATRFRKVINTLARLEQNPRHPGLNTPQYLGRKGPHGETVWQAYVENRTLGAGESVLATVRAAMSFL
ncbi:MAG: hypothetical protein ABI577_18505 [bacterium]